MQDHEKYMQRCLQIAAHGLGTTRPNPMVGCVIVYKGKIIGEGFTSPYGGPHAEVNAINSVTEKSFLKSSTLYVTLEPCSHHGKTPPCTTKIIESGIKNIVIGCQDPNPHVSGTGIDALKSADCEISIGVLEDLCRSHHRRFLCFHEKKRPYVILKWAQTADGFIAPDMRNERAPVWISSAQSRQLVHKWRAEEQAILIGRVTAEMDNPSLTVREWKGQNPIRVVLDPNSVLPSHLKVFNSEAETIKITSKEIDFSKQQAKNILKHLCFLNINSVIIEGGSKTLQTFIDENLWDEGRVFESEVYFGRGTRAPQFNLEPNSKSMIGSDILKIYENH